VRLFGWIGSGAALVGAAALAFFAVAFGICASATGNTALLGRQAALAVIYSLVLDAVVAAAAMTGWAARHRRSTMNGRSAEKEALPRPARAEVAIIARPGIVVGDIPQEEPKGFQPRKCLMAALHDSDGHGRVSGAVADAVTGMRGAGKTQLAAAYARARLGDGWRLVAWVSAEDMNSVLSGLAAVARSLGLELANRDRIEVGQAVRHHLEADGSQCLLVFDDADDPGALRQFVPAAGAAQILITSPMRAAAQLGRSIAVDVFTEEESLAFLSAQTTLADTAGARLLAAVVPDAGRDDRRRGPGSLAAIGRRRRRNGLGGSLGSRLVVAPG